MSHLVNLSTYGHDLKAAYDSILRPSDPKNGDNWALFGYDKGTNDLKVLGHGSGGLEELEDEFVDGKIQYAFVRIIDPNSELNKFILIAWCGDGVPESKKGLFNSHLADISNFLRGYHLQINARCEADVTPAQIMKRVNEGSGSKYSIHKETYEAERIRPLQSAYKKTEIPDIAALQRNPTKPEPAPKYNVGNKTFGASSASAAPAPAASKPLWNAPSPSSTPASSSSSTPVERSWKTSVGSSYSASTNSGFNKVAPPSSLLSYGQSSTPNEPTMNKAQQMRLEREAREKEERERIKREIAASEARERQNDNSQNSAQKQAEERRLQEQREREREQQQEQQRSQDRAKEERAAREKEERERAEAEDAARSAREAIKAREEAQARDTAAQEAEKKRQQEQQQQREKADKEAAEKRERDQREKAEAEERRRQQEQEEEERRLHEEEQRQLEEEEERRMQEEVSAATAQSVDLGADALLASSSHAPTAAGSVSAIVLYSYEKAEENEMSLVEGEIICNVTELDVGWWSGESEDGQRSGLFPANYVEVIEHSHEHAEAAHHEQEPVHSPEAAAEEHYHEQAAEHAVVDDASDKPSALALYDYNAGEPNEISFSEGDTLTEIEFVTEDWWSGRTREGAVGLFPSNYVELHQ
ncbi:drebrin-like protein [Entomortierella parvispora]|uniref:Drebrin-like protein n=1 Tax=Entomortierella parvispora TaxID=205924 RepID=A0A9P3H1D2_9FUNG|nr:drebrin-like protein [Entomortierella parvispora]